MDASRWNAGNVFLYRDPVDMRKGAAGLAALVSLEPGRDPADHGLYVFCNRARNKVKLLVWHLNGYRVLYKSLEKQRFHWPDWFDGDSITLDHQQLDYLIDGYDPNGMRPHEKVTFAHAFQCSLSDRQGRTCYNTTHESAASHPARYCC